MRISFYPAFATWAAASLYLWSFAHAESGKLQISCPAQQIQQLAKEERAESARENFTRATDIHRERDDLKNLCSTIEKDPLSAAALAVCNFWIGKEDEQCTSITQVPPDQHQKNESGDPVFILHQERSHTIVAADRASIQRTLSEIVGPDSKHPLRVISKEEVQEVLVGSKTAYFYLTIKELD